MTRKTARRRRHGFSLLEISVVLALIALAMGAILLFASKAIEVNKEVLARKQVMTIVSAIHSIYSGQSDFSGVNPIVVIQSKLIPTRWVSKGGNDIVTPWGGTYFIEQYDPGDGRLYLIIMLQVVPYTGCVALGTTDMGTSVANYDLNYVQSTSGMPFTPVAAQSLCSGDSNIVHWAFLGS